MHGNADHHSVDQSTHRQSAKKITSPIQLDGRSTGEGMSDDHGTVMRIRKKLAARVPASLANLFAAKNKRARWQRASDTTLANQLPKRKPKTFRIAVKIGG
jgi:hypothetical protein